MESHRTIAALLGERHQRILARWRKAVRELPAARGLEGPALRDQVPDLLREIARNVAVGEFREKSGNPTPVQLAAAHGIERMRAGFDVEEVVAEYNLLRRSIFDELAQQGQKLNGASANFINRLLDLAIGESLSSYVRQKSISEHERITEYLAFVMHDMKSPLAALTASRDLLHTRAGEDADLATVDRSMGQSLEQLNALVQRLLEESRSMSQDVENTLRPEHLPLKAVVDAVFSAMHGPADARGAQLLNHVPEDVVVDADPNLLDTVFSNLVHNAIEHAAAARIEVGAETSGDMLRCWVADDGSGIPADGLGQLFEPYATGNPARGTGLGLYMVRRYVEAHGGRIRVQPRHDGGTRFEFTLRRGGAGEDPSPAA